MYKEEKSPDDGKIDCETLSLLAAWGQQPCVVWGDWEDLCIHLKVFIEMG
jgi:hypothetical protein